MEADFGADWLRARANVVAVRVTPAEDNQGVLLNLGWYEVHQPAVAPSAAAQFIPTVVEQKAVVCDLCGSLDGGPACVKACPHDATRRFDARSGVPVW
jgi:Fe-S-cluster-containing hydrogenase component 2